MPVVFVNSREETPVDFTNHEELTARIVWCEENVYGEKAQSRCMQESNWTHPSDRDGAINTVRRVHAAAEQASYMQGEDNV
jgi:hypothetical protein